MSLPECFGLRESGLPAFAADRVVPAQSPIKATTVHEPQRSAWRGCLPSGIIMSDTLSTTTPTEKTDKLVPIDTDKEPIVWDNNRATIEGVLDEVHKFHLKSDQFVDLTWCTSSAAC